MASRDVEIRLTAKDQTSSTFRQISQSADRMGRDLEDVGRKGARSLDQAKQAGKDLAIGVGAVAGALTFAARAAAEEEATFRRLEAAVVATGAGYDQYAKQIDVAVSAGERLSFADDQTADALARMVGITGDVGASLNAMGVAMDFARLRNIDLSTSADLIGKALAGNTTALSRYGVVIAEGATSTEILAAIQAKAAGQAEAYADSTQGGIDRVKNAIDNQIESLGAWTGGIGQALATASEFTLQIALMGGGLVKLGSGLKGLSGAAGLGGLVASLGPVGLVAASGVAVVALVKLTDSAFDFDANARIAATGADALTQAINRLSAAGSDVAPAAVAYQEQLKIIQAAQEQLIAVAPDLQDAIMIPWQTTSDVGLLVMRAYNFSLEQAYDATIKASEGTALLGKAQEALGVIFEHSGKGAERAQEITGRLFESYQEGRFGVVGSTEAIEAFSQAIIDTVGYLDDYDRMANAADDSTRSLGQSAEGATKSIGVLFTGTKHLSDRLKDYTEGAERASAATKELAAAPPLVSGAKEVTAAIIPAPMMATPDPMAISFFTDLEIAYANVGRGALTAAEALGVFKGAQDGLLGSQDAYNQQLGEYNSQISAIDAALVLIQEKQAAGIALSTQEQGILDGSTAALERLTGGTNDATLARAELAIQYAENMRVGDQLNENMKGQQEITGALIGIVRDLILALDGVPEDVKTDIRAIDNATPTIRNVRGELDGINGKVATTYVDTVHRRVDIGFTDQLYTGGTVGTIHAGSRGAAGGITVGEFGREFIPNPPHGMQVMPHGASMSRLESEGRRTRRTAGITQIFRGPVTFSVDSPDNEAAWRQRAIGGVRP